MICVGRISLGFRQHIDRHKQECLDRPEIGVLEARSRISQALGTSEEELRTILLACSKFLYDPLLFTACDRGRKQETNRKNKVEEA